MSFASALKAYRNTLTCTDKTIAEASGISQSALSRYLRGERTPEPDSPVIANLASALESLSIEERALNPLNAGEIQTALEAELTGSQMIGMDFHMRLDALMSLVGITNAQVAEVTGVDPSYISRIRRSQRTPSDIPDFAVACSHLAANLVIERELLDDLGGLVGLPDIAVGDPAWDPYEESNTAEVIEVWLRGNQIVQSDMAKLDELLLWLDEEDFSPWLALDIDEGEDVEIPAPVARFHYGVGGMRTAEIEFLETAARTHARNLSLSSDTPLRRIPPSAEFVEQYGSSLEDVLKTDCHVNIFYNIERPFESTLNSLRLWTPFFITGQISAYYLRGVNNRLFFHMNYVCDTCALSSEAVVGHEEDGRYYFTTRPSDVSYYQRKMHFILEKAYPLLEIYRECDPGQKEAFEHEEAQRRAKGHGRKVGEDRFHNLNLTSYPGDCAVLTLPCGSTVVHFVMRHPKINYIIAHMK